MNYEEVASVRIICKNRSELNRRSEMTRSIECLFNGLFLADHEKISGVLNYGIAQWTYKQDV